MKKHQIKQQSVATEGVATYYLAHDFDKRVNPENPRWAGYRPRWLREAEQPVTIVPLAFKQYRAYVLCMSIQQCAAFLRVKASDINKWEAGTALIPYAAYIALRLVADIEYLPHQVKAWADWWIIPDGVHVGMLMNRRTGAMYSESEIAALWITEQIDAKAKRRAEKQNAELREQVATLTTENTRLRQLFNAQGVTQELRQMQERMAALLASIGTAEVFDYQPTARGCKLEAAA